jgi:uncharacterized membrane protein YcaP (DUF421 family)
LRAGAKRFLGRKTAFDIVVSFILGSMLSRAVNGSAAFFPTLGASFVLVLFHRLLAALCFRFHRLGTLVKGSEDLIVANGQIQQDALRRNYLSEGDLLEDLRLRSITDPRKVNEARIERSGDVSVIPMR